MTQLCLKRGTTYGGLLTLVMLLAACGPKEKQETPPETTVSSGLLAITGQLLERDESAVGLEGKAWTSGQTFVSARLDSSGLSRELASTFSDNNGKFTLRLPQILDTQVLEKVVFPVGELCNSTVNVSAPEALMAGIRLEGLGGKHSFVDARSSVEFDDQKVLKRFEGQGNRFVYVDRDVSIAGSITCPVNNNVKQNTVVNLPLKKGWNVVTTANNVSVNADGQMLQAITLSKVDLRDSKWVKVGYIAPASAWTEPTILKVPTPVPPVVTPPNPIPPVVVPPTPIPPVVTPPNPVPPVVTPPNPIPPAIDATFPKGTGSIQVTIVDHNMGAGLAASEVTLLNAEGEKIGRYSTDEAGRLLISDLAAGTYSLQARKQGMVGSDLHGIEVKDNTPTAVTLVQPTIFNTYTPGEPAKLLITRADGSPIREAVFEDKIDLNIRTTEDSKHAPGNFRVVYVQIERRPGTSYYTNTPTSSNWFYDDKQDKLDNTLDIKQDFPNAMRPNFLGGFGTPEGERVFLNVMAVDFNYNYSRYLIPIVLKVKDERQRNTVVAPTQLAATAFTAVQYDGTDARPFQNDGLSLQSAAKGTFGFVELRFCYDNTNAANVPYLFEVERSENGKDFTRIGKMGGLRPFVPSVRQPTSPLAVCPADASQRPLFYRDDSAELSPNKTYTYRVLAVGANSVASNVSSTTPLGLFTPRMLSPVEDQKEVSTMPTFQFSHNQLDIGADGAAYNLYVSDLMSGFNYAYPASELNALMRVEQGTGPQGNGIPEGETLIFNQMATSERAMVLERPSKNNKVLLDTAGVLDAARPQQIQMQGNKVSFPFAVMSEKPLQSFNPYQWELRSAFAYKYNMAEGGRVSAYSIAIWTRSSMAPVFFYRPVLENFDFYTGSK